MTASFGIPNNAKIYFPSIQVDFRFVGCLSQNEYRKKSNNMITKHNFQYIEKFFRIRGQTKQAQCHEIQLRAFSETVFSVRAHIVVTASP